MTGKKRVYRKERDMTVRNAREKDIPKMIELLQQVLEIHAALQPNIFLSGTTKYSAEDLKELLEDPRKPIYVAVDEEDQVLGYVFCQLICHEKSANTREYNSIYIDDLCVDETARGQHVGEALFLHVKEEGKALGCYDINLHAWEGNDARKFYDKMGMVPLYTSMQTVL